MGEIFSGTPHCRCKAAGMGPMPQDLVSGPRALHRAGCMALRGASWLSQTAEFGDLLGSWACPDHPWEQP